MLGWTTVLEVSRRWPWQGPATVGCRTEVDALRSRRQDRRLARARELLMILGVERYGLKLKDLAMELKKSPNGMTKTVARAARRRTEDMWKGMPGSRYVQPLR